MPIIPYDERFTQSDIDEIDYISQENPIIERYIKFLNKRINNLQDKNSEYSEFFKMLDQLLPNNNQKIF